MEEKEEIFVKGLDLQVDMYKNNLVNLINNSNLPLSITYFLLKDILVEVENLYTQNVQKQYQEYLQSLKDSHKEEEEEE